LSYSENKKDDFLGQCRELRTARGHMMPPLLHVYNALIHPADESTFGPACVYWTRLHPYWHRDNGTGIETTGQWKHNGLCCAYTPEE